MGTRSAVVRIKGHEGGQVQFEGRYVHWDGYPTGVGEALWNAYHGHFKKDLPAMLKFLIDDHTAGWSSLAGADFDYEPGFGHKPGPCCYCHGERSEGEQLVTDADASDIGCEYVYAFDSDGNMHVLSSYLPDGHKMIGAFGYGDPNAEWKPLAVVPLSGDEPDWSEM